VDSLHIVVLAMVQGMTEFLPISSSAHLVLLPRFLDWPDQGLVFDVAVHFGSLIAVVVYFRSEVRSMLTSWAHSLIGGAADRDSLLAWWVIVGTLPAIAVGFLLQGPIEAELRSPWVVAIASIGFGLLLWVADAGARRERDEYQLVFKDVLIRRDSLFCWRCR
jgi:undecaprenyl-diphosphatase